MFNWTTTTIINSLKDFSTGADLVKVWSESVDVDGSDLKARMAGASSTNPVLRIKRDHTFEYRYVSKIYKATGYNPQLCAVTIDCDALVEELKEALGDFKPSVIKPAHLRLSFYVALEGSEESIYANDWYQKGKPFSVGFDVTSLGDSTAADIVKKIQDNVKRFGVAMYGKKVFDLSADGNVLTLQGTHEYQRIKVATVTLDHGVHEHLLDIYEDGKEAAEGSAFELKQRGLNGFGTFHQLAKDLRLPTVHNTKWLKVKADETPEVGGVYDQYIITYCAPSMANPGFTVVGQHNMSVTTHVFWVRNTLTEAFEEALGDFTALIEEVNEVTPGTEATTDTPATPEKVDFKDSSTKATKGKVRSDVDVEMSTNHEQKLVHTEAAADAVTKA